jgi:hypothetical protein
MSPMSPPPDPNRAVLDLLLQIREAKSPLARVRVVAKAWRAVRGLTPKQRYEVAAQLGLDGADDLIEAIAAHQGTTPPAELMKAVNEVQKMDPAILKSITAKVRDPRQRAQGLKQGLQAIESALAGPEPAPPAPPRPAPPPVAAKPATSWPLREAQPSPKPVSPPVAAPVPKPVPPPLAPAPAAPPPPAPAPAIVSPPAPTPAPAPVPVARPAPVRPPEPVPPAVPVRSAVAERLGSIPDLMSRFRHLRLQLDQLRRLPSAELREILEVFPDGWARRRALSALIEVGAPARTADVLSLMDALQSPGDRAWCLGTLADSRALSSDERSALFEAAATPAGRRRLELRLGDR